MRQRVELQDRKVNTTSCLRTKLGQRLRINKARQMGEKVIIHFGGKIIFCRGKFVGSF